MRTKNNVATHRRRKRILKAAKGYYGAKHEIFKTAKQAVVRSQEYAYVSRRLRKRDFRKLWITRINAAVRPSGLSYSRFMHGLKLSKIELNRKMISELAIHNQDEFNKLISNAQKALTEVEKSRDTN